MLLILSPSSAKSPNVRNEIAFALDEQKIIIPILYQDCAVPLQLRGIHYVDFRTDYARGLTALLRNLGVKPREQIPVASDIAKQSQAASALEAQRSKPPSQQTQAEVRDQPQRIVFDGSSPRSKNRTVKVDEIQQEERPQPKAVSRPEPRRRSLARFTARLLWLLPLFILGYLLWLFPPWPARGELLTIHDRDGVFSVAWSPDGKRLATGSGAGAKIWDSATGNKLLTLGNGARISHVAWSPDGKRLATGGKGIGIWDLKTGKELVSVPSSQGSVWSLAWRPDGQQLAAAYENGPVRILDPGTGRQLFTMLDEFFSFCTIAWRPDGMRLAIGSGRSSNEFIGVWDLGTGQKVFSLSYYGSEDMAWSPDGKKLAAVDPVQGDILDAETGKSLLNLHDEYPETVSWSPDGSRLATASDVAPIRVLDASSGRRLIAFWPDHQTYHHDEYVQSLAWSPDGQLLATAMENKVKVWKTPFDPSLSFLHALPSATRRTTSPWLFYAVLITALLPG